jgi:SAM-dependent methyltransferase
MGAAAGGLQACPVGGHSVLHLQCGGGALTKMLASKGLRVCGADTDVSVAAKRGLRCFEYGGGGRSGSTLPAGALGGAREKGPYDVVLFYAAAGSAEGLSLADLLAPGSLAEVASVLAPGGRLCAEADGADVEVAARAVEAAGWKVDVAQEAPRLGRVRLVVQVPAA